MSEKSKPYWRITANLTGRKNWVETNLKQFIEQFEKDEEIEVVECSQVVSFNQDEGENFTGMVLMIVKATEEALLRFESPINFISSQLVTIEETIQQWRRQGWLCCKS